MTLAQSDSNERLKSAKAWFVQPEILGSDTQPNESPSEKPIEPGLFEIGLSLGGTVSAGAYTAGVLDFLIEALEQWELRKRAEKDLPCEKRTVPWHQVRIKVISGASGGSVCAAVLAKALGYQFPHIRVGMTAEERQTSGPQNPLYALWVQTLDIAGFCDSAEGYDGRSDSLTSLLNPGPLLRGCDLAATFPVGVPNGVSPVQEPRPYVSEPLTLLMTLSNLTGVPYSVGYGGATGRKQCYRRHADYVRVESYYHGPGTPSVQWPDAFRVAGRPAASVPGGAVTSWQEVARFARASGAFPVGFPPVKLARPAWHYYYQPINVGHAQGPIFPDLNLWGISPEANYTFLCVDGGAFNNEPVELARRHLAGWKGSNAYAPAEARRAVILVDPFADVSTPGPSSEQNVAGSGGALIGAWLANARFSTQDFLLAAEAGIRSRFLITATRAGENGQSLTGGQALCSDPLGAFAGFLHPEYRNHDFFLGRRNCQYFLREWFSLPAGNTNVFGPTNGTAHLQRNLRGEIPLIPLCGSTSQEQLAYPWPTKALDIDFARAGQTDSVAGMLGARIDEVLRRLDLSFPIRWILRCAIATRVTQKLVTSIKANLNAHRLYRNWWVR